MAPDEVAPPTVDDYDPEWLEAHLERERRSASVLSEVREAVFGAQDGLISTLAVVSTIGGATGHSFPVLVAGLASALAGIFSMSAGEYMSSKSQREIFEAQIAHEELEVNERPGEAEAEIAFLLHAEGLSRAAARRVAQELSTNKRVLLKTMVEKELGLMVEDDANPLRGAVVMGGSFGLAALVPNRALCFAAGRCCRLRFDGADGAHAVRNGRGQESLD
jgi:VIT1/CCC1 family predicted Fe2+/Mn2+ transporter